MINKKINSCHFSIRKCFFSYLFDFNLFQINLLERRRKSRPTTAYHKKKKMFCPAAIHIIMIITFEFHFWWFYNEYMLLLYMRACPIFCSSIFPYFLLENNFHFFHWIFNVLKYIVIVLWFLTCYCVNELCALNSPVGYAYRSYLYLWS